MIAAAKLFGMTVRLCRHASGPVPADVVKRPQRSRFIAHDQNRLAGQLRGEKRSRLDNLVGPAHDLPGVAEDHSPLQLKYVFIKIPGAGNGLRLLQRPVGIELRKRVLQISVHARSFHPRLTSVDIVIKDDR